MTKLAAQQSDPALEVLGNLLITAEAEAETARKDLAAAQEARLLAESTLATERETHYRVLQSFENKDRGWLDEKLNGLLRVVRDKPAAIVAPPAKAPTYDLRITERDPFGNAVNFRATPIEPKP